MPALSASSDAKDLWSGRVAVARDARSLETSAAIKVQTPSACDPAAICGRSDTRDEPPAVPSVAEIKVAPPANDPGVRSRVRDLTFGDSAKAMVDEAIWNLAPGDYAVYRTALQQGKPPEEAARAAGGQLAVIHRKISEYTLKLQTALSESKRTIKIEEIVDKPLEHRMLEIISNGKISELEKDGQVQELGAIQEWVKHGQKGDITLAETNRILLAVGDRLNWGGTVAVSDDIKAVYRTLFIEFKTAIRAAAPEAQNFQDRLINLYAAKSDLDNAISHFGMHA